jgi:hypothetical protein
MISKIIIFINYVLLVTFDHWSKGTNQNYGQKHHPTIGQKNHPNHIGLVEIDL